MVQCDSHYQCCACTAADLKCYSLVVQSPRPPWGGNLHYMGGGGLQGGSWGLNQGLSECWIGLLGQRPLTVDRRLWDFVNKRNLGSVGSGHTSK